MGKSKKVRGFLNLFSRGNLWRENGQICATLCDAPPQLSPGCDSWQEQREKEAAEDVCQKAAEHRGPGNVLVQVVLINHL